MPRLDADSGSSSSGSDSEYDSVPQSPRQQPVDGPSRKEQRAEDLRSVRSTYGDTAKRPPSNLRRSANAHTTKYPGIPTTSDQLFGAHHSEEEEEADSASEGDEQAGSGSDLGSENKNQYQDLQRSDDEEDDDESGGSDQDNEQDVSGGPSESDDNDPPTPDDGEVTGHEEGAPHTGEATLAAQQAEEDRLAQDISNRRELDAKRGKSVQKQRAAYELALDMRIRAQKVTVPLQGIDTNVLALINQPGADELQSKVVQTATELLQLSSDLFSLRTDLMTRNGVDPPEAAKMGSKYRGKKRKFTSLSDTQSALEDHLEDVSRLSSQAWVRDGQILNKWSSRARSDPALGGGADKFAPSGGFKAINQSATAQIERALHPQAIGRLRERALTWRGPARVHLPTGQGASMVGPSEDKTKESSASSLPDAFDDTDFYHSLLRELIEARAAAGASGGSSLGEAGVPLPSAGLARDKGPKPARDQKATKGRKLRYETHEKIVHFMPPVPRVTWGQGQMDRLFTQLAGAAHGLDLNAGQEENEEDDASVSGAESEADQPVEDEGFRLFG